MSFDPRKSSVCMIAAGVAIDMRKYSGGRIWVYPQAAGTLTAELAPASDEDNCVPADDWNPVQTTNACADPVVTEDLSVDFTEEDVAAKCSIGIDCVRDFVRFSADVLVAGTNKSYRPPVNYTCGPTLVN